ncbi:MAG: hypothetical protein KAU35_09685, partial [candidate division Zixibacteria bacterium]|nr:hypothetical protein [candidate division Zixibacteria bacterium]
GGRIRTHGTLRYNGFQDRRFRPLSHSSVVINFARPIPLVKAIKAFPASRETHDRRAFLTPPGAAFSH